MEITVLGPPAIRIGGDLNELGPRLQRLLAVLVVDPGVVVSVDRLVDIVWDGLPPEQAETSLRSYLTRLRRAFGPDQKDIITFRQPGYQLDSKPGELDSKIFETEIDEAGRLFRLAEGEEAMAVLERALARWRGPAFAGFEDEEWARPEATRLEGRRREARQLYVEVLLAVGSPERAIAESQALIEADSLGERPRELLMRSFSAASRLADALRVLPEYRIVMGDVGLEPSAALTELESRIARGELAPGVSPREARGYELGSRIGEGAFAVVHQAVQIAVGRGVAVKVIRAELADRPDFVRRFEYEARVVASVEHPNVVPLYDFWREPGAAFLVMRLMRGGSVADALRTKGPFSIEAALRLVGEIGPALEAAHAAGVVHRDVRPANLLLDDADTAYLADFGIALPTATADHIDLLSPAYAAPEVLRGEVVGPTADIMSLAVTVFELFRGQTPFVDTGDRADLIRQQLNEPFPSLRPFRSDLPARVDDVLARASAKSSADRHPNISAFVADLESALASGRSSAPVTPYLSDRPNPYVGLHAFEEADAHRFFGREGVVTQALEALDTQPFVALVGPSGSGKSSIIRAGMIPRLRNGALADSDQWFITTMFPGPDPFESLEAALLRVAVNPPTTLSEQLGAERGIVRSVKRVLPDERGTLLIVIDQFEELFTQARDDGETIRFLHELAAALNEPGGQIRVVATLRADHYDRPLRDRKVADLFSSGTLLVGPMSPNEIESAIVRPARGAGADLEPALVADLVAEVSHRPSTLPLLQFALTELYEQRVSGLMLASTYESMGKLTGAVAARADRLLDDGEPEDVQIARRIFSRLVLHQSGESPSRRRALRSEFSDETATARILEAFTAARLLSVDRDPATREATVEVAHEALLRDWPRLTAWLEQDRTDHQTLLAVSDGGRRWRASDLDPGELARGGRLHTVVEFADRRPDLLNRDEQRWVETSRETAEAEEQERSEAALRDRRQNRRLRQLLVVATVILIAALVAGALALGQRNLALASEENADIERLIALSASENDEQPGRAMLLALEANRRRDDAATRTAVHRAIASEQRLTGLFPEPIPGVTQTDLSANGEVGVAASFADGKLAWFDGPSGEAFQYVHASRTNITKLAVSGNGLVAAFGGPGGDVEFIDRNGNEVAGSINMGSDFGAIALDHLGHTLMANLSVFDVQTGQMLGEYDPGDGFTSDIAVFTPDGDSILTTLFPPQNAPGTYLVDVVDVATQERLWRIDDRLGEPSVLAVSDDSRVAIGYANGMVTLHRLDDVDDDEVVFKAHADEVSALGFDAAGGLVTAGDDGEIKLWSTEGVEIAPPLRTPGEVADIAVSPRGTVTAGLVAGGHLVFDPTGGPLIEDVRPIDTIGSVSPYGPTYDIAGPDFRSTRIMSIEDGRLIKEIDLSDLHPDGVSAPRYSLDGNWIMTIGFETLDVSLTEIGGDGQRSAPVRTLFEREFGIPNEDEQTRWSIRPDGRGERVFVVANGNFEGFKAVWIDVFDHEIDAGPLDLDSAGPALVLNDGRVAIGGPESPLMILPADLDADPQIVTGSEGLQAFHQDPVSGNILVGGTDGVVGILDQETLDLQLIEGLDGSAHSGAFSPSGGYAAVTTAVGGLQLVDIEHSQMVGIPIAGGPRSLAVGAPIRWSEDGKGVWVVTNNGLVRLSADPERWREIACETVRREMSESEWATFVSPTVPPVSACSDQ